MHTYGFIHSHLALQEALRLKQRQAVDEVVAVSLGPQQVQVSRTI